MRKRTELLACLMILSLAGNSVVVYGDTAKTNNVSTGEENPSQEKPEEKPEERQQGEHEKHEMDEGTVIAPSCTEKGYTLFRCKVEGCTYEERKDEKAPLGHDLKEVSRTEAEGEIPGYILYECQRDNCDYQTKTEIKKDEENPSENPSDNPSVTPGQGDDTSAPNHDETKPESGNDTSDPGKTMPDSEDKTSESIDSKTGEKESSENPKEGENPDSESKDNSQQPEELPEVDPDSEGEAMTWASATSTDIVTEYDPETASDTIQIPADASHPEKVTEIEGRTVPEGTARVTRDSNGNITDLEFSMELVEMRYGVSFTSEAETLKSVTLTDLNNEKNFRITLKAEKKADELGIRLTETEKGTLIILTENKKELYIVKADEKDGKTVFTTSSGGSCEISRENKEISVPSMHISEKDINRILLTDLREQRPAVKFLSSGKSGTKDREQEENLREKQYWIRPYGDPCREPVIIKIYEKM